jgi:monovalent cation:H+ antiporter, CPA1 family
MLTGNWGATFGMQLATRTAVDAFWGYTAFLLNSLVFLLMGLEINLAKLLHFLPEILIGWVAINVARAVLVYSNYFIIRACGRNGLPASWAAVLTWGGLRGGLSMVLALSLPRDFSHREMILHMTFGVVLLTLLVQGLTIKPLIRRFGLANSSN